MNFRLTVGLFAAILVLGVVLLVTSFLDDSASPTDVLVEELAAAAVKDTEVDVVEIERPGQTGKLVMARVGTDKWEIREPIKATADRFAVEGMVSALFRAKPTTYAETTGNLGVHGLEPPSLRVTLRKGEKASTINVGEVTNAGNKSVAFVTTSARPKRPMAVLRSSIDSLLRDTNTAGRAGDMSKWTADFRAKQVFGVEARKLGDVTGLKLTSKDKVLELARAGTDWTFVSPAGWGAADATGDTNPAATGFTGVDPMLTALTGLQALAADDFLESPGDLKQYGLEPNGPDAVRVELKTKDATQVVYVGKPVPAQPPAEGVPAAPSNKWYVRVEGEAGVIRASAGKLEGLAVIVADPNPMRDRTLLTFDKARIDAIDLTFGGQTVKLRKAGAVLQWKLYGAPHDPTVVDPKAVDAVLSMLAERRTIRDFPPTYDANFAPAEQKVEVKLWADGVDSASDPKADPKAEPKLKGTPFTLLVGKQEGDKFFVRRTLPGGAKADFTMPEKVPAGGAQSVSIDFLVALRKDRLTLLDTALPTFSPFNATRVTIANGPAVTEVEHAADATADGKWAYAKPDPQKGRAADSGTILADFLGTLSRLSATRYVSESPTEAQLTGWGLDPKAPRLKVTVGLKPTDPDKERAYSFGNDTGDGFVYAKQDGRPAVFTVPKAVFDRMATADLRDKTVLKFDKAKVKGLRVRGWKEAAGQMMTREFDKKGTEWTARSKDYAADGVKLNGLLNVLDGLKAKSFVEGQPRPEHRFPPETESGFEVTIELDGAPPLSVNIAGETPDKSAFFGFSSMLPPTESLFTVAADALRPFKASAGSLVK